MNTELVRGWLGLPPGPWPPDDRSILGLPAGPAAVADVELRAFAQMEKLRPHQLVHPDLVTEGMNRLAQALIALTDEANRAARRPTDAAADIVLDADLLGGARPATEPPAGPVVLEAEVVSVPRMLERRPAVPKRKRRRKRRPKSAPPVGPAVDVPPAEAIPPGATYSPIERRRGYQKLAEMRRVLRRWEELRPYFAAPSEPLATPGNVFGFLESVRECRRAVAVDGDTAWFEEHGGLVLTILRSPHAIAVFRTLVRPQRQEVATDWARTTAHLRGLYLGLREEMHLSKPRRKWGASLRTTTARLRLNPEWMIGAVVLLAVAVALVRSIRR